MPLIDLYIAPKPFAYRKAMVEKRNGAKPVPFWQKVPKSALILCLIALVTGVALSGVYTMTKDTIEAQQMAANAESYKAVVPDAETFETDEALTAAVDALGGEVYGTDYGRVHINDVIVGRNAAGEAVGYVISVTSSDGFDGDITLSMGIQPDGTLNGISFTELHETAGMGMRCDEPEFRDKCAGRADDPAWLRRYPELAHLRDEPDRNLAAGNLLVRCGRAFRRKTALLRAFWNRDAD